MNSEGFESSKVMATVQRRDKVGCEIVRTKVFLFILGTKEKCKRHSVKNFRPTRNVNNYSASRKIEKKEENVKLEMKTGYSVLEKLVV